MMAGLALGKRAVGARLAHEVVLAEGRVTAIDALLAVTVLAGLVLNSAFGLWWADIAVGFVIAIYAGREARELLRGEPVSEGVASSGR